MEVIADELHVECSQLESCCALGAVVVDATVHLNSDSVTDKKVHCRMAAQLGSAFINAGIYLHY